MLVTLMSKNKLYSVLLPEKVRGKFWIEDRELPLNNPFRNLVGIEGEDNGWTIHAGRRLKLKDENSRSNLESIKLEVNQMYAVELPKRREAYLFTESYTGDRCTFKKYRTDKTATLNIGRGKENQIIIENSFVSSVHARLSFANGKWSITDNNSKNGVYVNENRLHHFAQCCPGDVIYIMGVKIVLGNQFIAVNNPDGKVKLDHSVLYAYVKESTGVEYSVSDENETSISYYYRSPAFTRTIMTWKLKIDAPPSKENQDMPPILLSMAPSLVMGVASFSTGVITMITTVQNQGNFISALPSCIMSVSMLFGMGLIPFLMRKREKKQKILKEKTRQEKYLKYLDILKEEIRLESVKQREILSENFPFILTKIQDSDFLDMGLWSRASGRGNFLVIRVGMGNAALNADITLPEQRFAIEDDICWNAVFRMGEERRLVTNVPITYSMIEHRVSGIVGPEKAVEGLLHSILLQISALHSYDEVKLILLCEETGLKKYNYVRWIPHIWDNNFRMRYLAVNTEEVRNLSAYFLREMDRQQEVKGAITHYLVISTSKVLSDGCAFVAELLKREELGNFHYLSVYDEQKNLPRECSLSLQLTDTQGQLFDYRAQEGPQLNFIPDVVSGEMAEKATLLFSDYRLDLQSGKYALPEMITFLELYRVGKYEHLNITDRWRMSNPVSTLRAPVGVNTDGELFYLDLHEEAHGPHGLIAGMTGSGKSEFIITYVLSMAVNYSPEDVAFILIDYKGGGLAGAFESDAYHLPHLSGTITNLDGAAITRSLLSIQSELKRRQRVFNEARKVANEGTMDIYKYQKLYRDGVVKEAMPHLVIISDEFAELKAQESEFMEQLISTARIGRSLGVHLILATQKPSGVVNDQIWANSKFKVSLKVQDRADSMEMFKRPEAADLIETGRFYLQVGYNELFELGQSAWCGAPYIPMDAVQEELDERIQIINHQGNVIEETKPDKREKGKGVARKQIVEIVQYLTQIAEEEHVHATPLWLPEIPPHIRVEMLEEKYGYHADYILNPVLGELDDPLHQDQRLLTVPFGRQGNAVCYGNATSGKEGFLVTMLYSLYRTCGSDMLNAYILDFGSETLQMFAEAPQTGGIALSGEDEKIENLFGMLGRELNIRKKQFVSSGGDYLSYRRIGNMDCPAILVVINEYANFAEQYEALDDKMASLTRECTKYGIYFLLTNLSQTGIRYKLQQNLSLTYVLQMNDKTEYTAILGNTGGVYPSRISGRGIFRDKNVYEFQTACIEESPEATAGTVRKLCQKLKSSGQSQAKAIPVMPKAVRADGLPVDKLVLERIPIGLDVSTAEPVTINMCRENVFPVLAMDWQDITAFAEGLAKILQKSDTIEFYLFDSAKRLKVEEVDEGHYGAEKAEERVAALFEILVERNNAYVRAKGNVPPEMDLHPLCILIMGLSKLKQQLSEDGKDKLRLILERASGKFGMSVWIMEDYQSARGYLAQSWFRGDGIWIGNGISDQICLKVIGRNPAFSKNLDFTSGFVVKSGNVRQIKLVITERIARELEEQDE